jgi:hypothetical protein|tara:strand:- start:532 stop:1284 length:753 start_codon:yes stop_codon:yes gene_type:complete
MIIVGGCSFTDKNMPKSAIPNPMDFKMWPELLSEKLNTDVINTAKCGSGNERIYHSVMNEIFKHDEKKIDRVIISWTEWTRQDFMVGNTWKSIVPKIKDMKDEHTKARLYDYAKLNQWYNECFNNDYPNIENVIRKNLHFFYSMYAVCKQKNIELRMFQMLNCINNYYNNEFELEALKFKSISEMLDNNITLELNGKIFYGWPGIKRIGGYTLMDVLKRKNQFMPINHIDAHPNEKSQKYIMELIYNEIY